MKNHFKVPFWEEIVSLNQPKSRKEFGWMEIHAGALYKTCNMFSLIKEWYAMSLDKGMRSFVAYMCLWYWYTYIFMYMSCISLCIYVMSFLIVDHLIPIEFRKFTIFLSLVRLPSRYPSNVQRMGHWLVQHWWLERVNYFMLYGFCVAMCDVFFHRCQVMTCFVTIEWAIWWLIVYVTTIKILTQLWFKHGNLRTVWFNTVRPQTYISWGSLLCRFVGPYPGG